MKNIHKSTRRSLRGSNKVDNSPDDQSIVDNSTPQHPMEEDFELVIAAACVPKLETVEKEIMDEFIPMIGEVSGSEDTAEDQNENEIHVEAVNGNKKEEFNNNNNVDIDKMDIEQSIDQNPYAKMANISFSMDDGLKSEDESDSGIGSLETDDTEDERIKFGLHPGVVVWCTTGQSKWWPCVIIEDRDIVGVPKKKGTVYVKYFNYNAMIGVVPIKNVFLMEDSDPMTQLWAEVENRKLPKSKVKLNMRANTLRAVEEARIFLKFDKDKRAELLNTIASLKKNISIDVDEASNIPPHLKEYVKEYIKHIKVYDEEVEKREKELKQKQTEKRLSKSESSRKDEIINEGGFMANAIMKAESSSSRASNESSVERVALRQSTRVVMKRKLSLTSSSRESTPSSDSPPAQPVPKKRRISQNVVEDLPLEERFKFSPKDILDLFKNAPTQAICLECCDTESEKLKGHKCVGCSNFYHETCCESMEISKSTIRHMTGDTETIIEKSTVELKCKKCSTNSIICFLCKESVTDDEKFMCNLPDCQQIYHTSCLEKCPQSKSQGFELKYQCPQHSCHTCYWKKTNRTGTAIKCVKCPAAYHSDIYCLPAGSQVISKTQIICPRHKSREELKKKVNPINLDYCCRCISGGSLVCCEQCPMAFHEDCLLEGSKADSDKFICDDCEKGMLPLYNTIVWAKVGTYRWWPAFIKTEGEKYKSRQAFSRQFCVQFLGSYEHYWFTPDQVFSFTDATQGTKTGNKRLDAAYSKAIKEADEMLKYLESVHDENSNSKPKPFRRIHQNQPVAPVKLKKDTANEICACKVDDPMPCGVGSDCIVRHLRYECGKLCPAGEKCQNQQLRKRDFASIKLKKTGDRGFGAFAKNDIPAGSLVIEYVGELINAVELKRRKEIKESRSDSDYYFAALEGDLFIDAEPAGNKSRFLNHSCDPNCITEKFNVDGNLRMAIMSKKFIKAGTELTFNYDFAYFNEGPGKFRCYCKTSKCTGFIGGIRKELESRKSNKKSGIKYSEPSVVQKVPSVSILDINEGDPIEKMLVHLDPQSEDRIIKQDLKFANHFEE